MYRDRKRGDFLKIFLTALLTTLGVGALAFILISGYISRNEPELPNPQQQNLVDVPGPQQITVGVPEGEPVAAAVARTASPGVVGISVLKVDSNSIFNRNVAEEWGVGSGVIVSPNGYILTNHHVAGGKNRRIVVSLADGRDVEGVTLWSDPVLDLAVVKVELTGLTSIPLGDSNTVRVGDPAIAIGNPLGLQFQRTVTSGIVSALNRTIEIETERGRNFMEDLIQTDASINPGNSGGPLLNARGEVIGINTIKVTTAEAIGFAIPINAAKPIIQCYAKDGEFQEPYMGIFAYDKEVIPYLDGNLKIDNGIYVARVDEESPAYKSGIRLGCIISKVDDINVNTMMQLRSYLYTKKPGDTVNITHLKKGEKEWVTVPVNLAEKERDGLVTR